MDLEYVLSVISDGPTKSFAFRRLGYLQSKFTMYSLLNEFQEIADMKVCDIRFEFARWINNFFIFCAMRTACSSSVSTFIAES